MNASVSFSLNQIYYQFHGKLFRWRRRALPPFLLLNVLCAACAQWHRFSFLSKLDSMYHKTAAPSLIVKSGLLFLWGVIIMFMSLCLVAFVSFYCSIAPFYRPIWLHACTSFFPMNGKKSNAIYCKCFLVVFPHFLVAAFNSAWNVNMIRLHICDKANGIFNISLINLKAITIARHTFQLNGHLGNCFEDERSVIKIE